MKKIRKPIVLLLVLTILSTMFVPSFAGIASGVRTSLHIRTSSTYKYMNNWAYPNNRNGIHLAAVAEGQYKGEPAYCIEFGKSMGDDGQLETITDIEKVPAWKEFDDTQKYGIIRATIYGYPNYTYGVSNDAAQVATQFVIWEYSQGYRTSADGDNPTAGLNGWNGKIENAINSAGFDVRQQYYKSGVLTEYEDIKYVHNDPQTVTVRANKTEEVKFNNKLKKFRVEVTKKDSEKGDAQGDATLKGAVYGLYNNGELVKEYTTDEDGKFTTDYEICGSKWTLKELVPSEGYNLDKTVYEIPAGAENFKIELNTIKKLVEVQAPYGYVLDKTPIVFDITAENAVDENGITVITVKQENTAQKGVIEISKTGEVFASVKNNDEVYTPVYEEQGLADAEFEIYADEDIVTADGTVRAKQGELVDTIVTDSTGTAKSKLLYLGEYTVKETKAPYTFALNTEEQHLALTYEGQEISTISRSVSFYDQRQTSGIELTKVLEQNELYKVGMNDEVQNVKFSVYAAEEVTAQDGEIIPADGLITTASVTADNTLTFDCDLPVGCNWYVQETETDEHYIISDEKYNFSTEYQGQDVERYDIKINDGEGILNPIKSSVVNGKKLDDSGNPLKGALIGIFFDTSEEFTKDTAITTVMSADDGTFSFTDIPVGTYIVKEIETPKDYLLDEKSYIVEITENEQTVELELVNVLKRGSIHGIKIDNLSNPLEGALIGLFSADTAKFTKKNALMTATSDKEGNFEFNNLPVGKYIVKELKAPKGYILNEKVYEVTIEENEQIIELKIVNEAEIIEVKSPMTGADYAILFTSLAAVVCTAAAITVFLKKRKENNEGTNLHQI